ncbi:hypothetical protein ACQ9LF_08965 [Anaerohalosphaeraceae bacterium U12dextr]|jgi:hypothetical protein
MTVWFAQSSNGNINDASKWGDAPTSPSSYLTFDNLAAGDILQLNGKTAININVSFACTRVSSAQEGGLGTASGNLVISSGTITIGTSQTKTEIRAGSSCPLTISGGTVVINGDVTAGNSYHGLTLSGDSTSLTVNGRITGGSAPTTHGISRTGSGTLVVSNPGADALYTPQSGKAINDNGGGGTITINGNINAYGTTYCLYTTNSLATIIVNGNVYGTSGCGISHNSVSGMGATLTINGNVTGGSWASCSYAMVSISQYVSATIYGNVTGGGNCGAYGFATTMNSRPSYVYGNVIASSVCSGVSSNSLGAAIIYIQGCIYDSLSASAYCGGVRLNLPSTASIHRVYDWSGNPVNLPLQLPPDDVKKGLVHGEVVGTLPPASAFRRTGRFV